MMRRATIALTQLMKWYLTPTGMTLLLALVASVAAAATVSPLAGLEIAVVAIALIVPFKLARLEHARKAGAERAVREVHTIASALRNEQAAALRSVHADWSEAVNQATASAVGADEALERRMSAGVDRELDLLREEFQNRVGDVLAVTTQGLSTLEEAGLTQRRFSNYSNVSGFTVHDRNLQPEDVAHIRSTWLPQLGLTMSVPQLMYLAHDICRAEDWSEGRLATTVQSAVLRSLALMSLGAADVQLLEIGTLFGIGAGALYRSGHRSGQNVQLTIVDPLEGYYDVDLCDATTGVPVTQSYLMRNLRSMSVADSDVRLVVGRSTDDHVFAEVSDRMYDYVLIDGDHSAEGVRNDFLRYGPLVRAGGLIVFDDYDTAAWPDIRTFVDAHVRTDSRWEWIGADWGTALLARRGVPATAVADDTAGGVDQTLETSRQLT